MRNPWLDIPLADYEAHMALAKIGQSRMIADQLAALVRAHSPSSVAVVGCAGGNGFDCFVGSCVGRVVATDINPEYIEEARRRYEVRIPGLQLYVEDIQAPTAQFSPVDLVYVALVLEYVELAQALSTLSAYCKPDGVLAVLAQLPHETLQQVSPSPYSSLQRLAPGMRLVSPEELQRQARQVGFLAVRSTMIRSPGGKSFSVDEFRLDARSEGRTA